MMGPLVICELRTSSRMINNPSERSRLPEGKLALGFEKRGSGRVVGQPEVIQKRVSRTLTGLVTRSRLVVRNQALTRCAFLGTNPHLTLTSG